ncbi:MAG: adenosylcobinamide-GDP ribazoletransferase [Hydrogenophilales bacterium 28-61-23]|nr:MAG: adenosylcobinamide-GDP ribazoletransferase [Hydrogenophilales bacterium 28-61-23]
MRGLILAVQFLTRLPTPRVRDFQADDLARAAIWFPLVGLLVGALVASALFLGARVDPWLGALLGLLVWVWVTGALHLDGLADLADALGAAHGDKKRLLDVLADPHVGAFGVVALVLQLLAKLVLLMLLASAPSRAELFWAVLLIPAWARLGTLVWARLPSIKPGLGERFAWRCPTAGIALWGTVLLPACALYPALLAAPPLILAWRVYLLRRLGGMSGDALGAGVEWLESGLLLAVVLAAGFAA